jgi:hypothetical protein
MTTTIILSYCCSVGKTVLWRLPMMMVIVPRVKLWLFEWHWCKNSWRSAYTLSQIRCIPLSDAVPWKQQMFNDTYGESSEAAATTTGQTSMIQHQHKKWRVHLWHMLQLRLKQIDRLPVSFCSKYRMKRWQLIFRLTTRWVANGTPSMKMFLPTMKVESWNSSNKVNEQQLYHEKMPKNAKCATLSNF